MRKKLHFDIVSRYDKKLEPATAAVPFVRGELWEEELSRLVIAGAGENLYMAAQYKATAYWPDHSIKWLLVHVLVDLPANEEKDYYLYRLEKEQTGKLAKKEKEDEICIAVSENGRGLEICNGPVMAELAGPGRTYLFESIRTADHVYGSDEVKGPFVVDQDGVEYGICVGEGGWEILEAGPVKAVLRAKGKHAGEKKQWLDFSVVLTFWLGKPWILMDYQFINREADRLFRTRPVMELNNEQAGLKYDKNYPFELLRKAYLSIQPETGDSKAAHGIYTSGFNFHAKKGEGEDQLRDVVTADTIINTANEMFPEVLFSIYGADWNSGTCALTAGIHQAYQNFPKALGTSGHEIRLEFLPDIGETLKLPQGVAKTTKCYFYFHEVELEEHMLLDRLHQFELPAFPVLEPEAYMEAEVFDHYVSDHYHHATERFLYRYVDSRSKGLGILNFGDGPEWEYMKQGRSAGQLVWINNEYDMPHNFMIMLARTGDRRYYDYMKAGAEHWFDVDFCHYSEQPYREGLLYTHSVDHVSGQPVPSHQWVEGFLDYYHMTGSLNGREAAMSIGEGLLGMMELPIYQAAAVVEPREIGWAMRSFLALYKETGETRWLEACRPIAEVYVDWAEKLGTFTTPYPDNYMDRVPFMIHVGLAGLYQYYRIVPVERVRSVILQVIDDLIRHCYVKRADVFMGKQYPAVRFLNLNGMVLESLAIAYELTGDASYIEKGLGMFDWITKENQPPVYDFSKYRHDSYTVIYDCPAGPKRCAQTLLPLLHYYRYAFDLGYIRNREETS